MSSRNFAIANGKIVGMALILFSTAFQVEAQTADSVERKIYFIGGIQQNDFTEFRLKEPNANNIENQFELFGIGFQYINESNLAAGIEAKTSLKHSWDNSGINKEFQIFTINTSFGYLFRPTNSLDLIPNIGVGGGFGFLSSAFTTDFDSLSAPKSESVYNSNLLLTAAIALDYHLPIGETESGKKRSLLVGFNTGYSFVPISNWRYSNDIELKNAPDTRLQGIFAQLRIGLSYSTGQ